MYAVDEHTLLIKSFVFDGDVDDTFFVLSKNEDLAEPLEYLADEVGSRQALATYMNEDIQIRLNPNTAIADYKSFGVYSKKTSVRGNPLQFSTLRRRPGQSRSLLALAQRPKLVASLCQ